MTRVSPDHAIPIRMSGPGRRRLVRSRRDSVLGGVCGGLARYLGLDPLWLRVTRQSRCLAASVIAYRGLGDDPEAGADNLRSALCGGTAMPPGDSRSAAHCAGGPSGQACNSAAVTRKPQRPCALTA